MPTQMLVKIYFYPNYTPLHNRLTIIKHINYGYISIYIILSQEYDYMYLNFNYNLLTNQEGDTCEPRSEGNFHSCSQIYLTPSH